MTFSTEISNPFPRGKGCRKARRRQGGRRFYTQPTAPTTATTVFLYSFLFCFRGAQSGGCAEPPAHKNVGRGVPTVSVCRFRVSGYAGSKATDKQKDTPGFSDASVFPSFAGRQSGLCRNHGRLSGRQTGSHRPFRPLFPHGIVCRTGKRMQDRLCAGASVRKTAPPTQFLPCFPYSVRSAVLFAGSSGREKTYPKNNSINPKGRNKCTLSFRKKCCWTI